MNPDDPKFTAHALGELADLTPGERAEIAALLTGDPSAAAEAQETQALAARLRAELQGEQAAPLHDEQRVVVLDAASDAERGGKLLRFPRRARVLAALAACLAVSVSAALLFPAMQAEKAAARKSLAAAEPADHSDAGLLAAQSVVGPPPPLESQPVFSAPATQTPQLASATPQAPRIGSITTTDAGSVPLPVAAAAPRSAELPMNAPTVSAIPPSTPVPAQPPSRGNGAEQIKQLFVEAEGFYQTGRFDLAKKRAEQILSIHPTNKAARNMEEKIDRKVSDYGLAAHNETRADAIKQADLAWQRPIRRSPQELTRNSTMSGDLAEQNKPREEAFVLRFNTANPAGAALAKDAVNGRQEDPTGRLGAFPVAPTTLTAFDAGVSDPATGESFEALADNAFLAARENPLSTFSIDVDTASYAIVRRFLNRQQQPPKGAVRIEELLNYFPYDYPQPQGDAPFSATMEVAACPWTPAHRLVRIGLKGREIAKDERPASNLVFLIDVSGSMKPENKLPLLKQSLALLIDQLGAEDQVAMVVYAGSSGCVLEPTRDKQKMREALQKLEAGGSTNGGSGVQLAYQLAEKSFIKGGTNRVILATDGDWNVGITRQDELLDLIKRQAKSGVFLTVLGVGMDNLKDTMLVKLADTGNGHYAYLDTLLEAKKVLVDQLSSTLVTIAKDVKIQVEFNPAQVGAYRLIGYEKRKLAAPDFNDDKKDAGEIGAGHTVTALYEVVPAGQPIVKEKPVDSLKYQPKNVLRTKEWKVPSRLIDGVEADAAATGSKIADRTRAKEWLMKQGAKFEGAATAIYIVRSNRLVVRNTPDQIAFIDGLLSAALLTEAKPSPLYPPAPPMAGDPSDTFISAYMALQQGEEMEEIGDFEAALAKFESAAALLAQLTEQGPGWQPEIVKYRKERTREAIARAGAKTKAPAAAPAPAGEAERLQPFVGAVLVHDAKESAKKVPASAEMLTLKLRYKEPAGDQSKLLEFPLTDTGADWSKSSRDFRFAAAVAGYGMLLRDSPHKGEATWSAVQEWAQEGKGTDAAGYRAEFSSLLDKAQALSR